MKSDWQYKRLGELVTFTSGGTPSKSKPHFWNGNIPWISAKTMREERVSSSDLFITEEGLQAGSKLAPKGSILLLTRGSGLFNGIPICLAEEEVAFNQDVKCLKSCSEVENKFIFYWLISQKKYLSAKVGVTGIGAGKFDTDFLTNLIVPIPPKEEREQIVALAEALSQRIETNKKINENLEKQAQALFNRWFVDFEFPNEEGKPYRSSGGKMVESEMGMIPEGWEIRILGDMVDTHGGYSYKGDELQPSKNALATIKNFNRNGGLRIDGFKEIIPLKNVKPAHYLSLYDVLVAHTDLTQAADVLGNCELLLTKLDYEEIIYSMDLVKVTPKIPELNNFVLAQILSDKRFKNHALGYRNGTTVLHLSKKAVPDYELPVPNNLVLFEKLGDLLRPLYIQMSGNIVMNRRLVELRDTLLPKLMKGELSVMNHKTKRESFEA